MSHSRAMSEASKQPHSISLKVLRLSRPSLSQQYSLPKQSKGNDLKIEPRAAVAWDDPFILSPVLTLPPSFGSARVGETFSCTLCASNELPTSDEGSLISGLRITADMQTPSQPSGVTLELEPAEVGGEDSSLKSGETLQKNVRFDLREEGNHMLAVTIAYTETHLGGEGRAASGKGRSFRKIYQFVAQQLLSVRTKTQVLPPRNGLARYSLEAQLENLGDVAVTLESVAVHPKPRFQSMSLNWDMPGMEGKSSSPPLLNPQDVYQVAFLLHESSEVDLGEGEAEDGRVVLGQLSFQWRSGMGDMGALSTGWLSYRKRKA